MLVANENNKCFVILSNKIEGRLDPYFYKIEFRNQIEILLGSKFKIFNLRDVCTQITDGTHFTPNYTDKGIQFLSVKNVRENKINFTDTKFISEKEHNRLIKRCNPKPKDILLTKVGTVGLSAVVPDDSPEFSLFVSVALLKIDKNIANPFYVSIFLNGKYAKSQIRRVVKGIGVPDLHLENIAEIKIPIPPLEIQNKIVGVIQSAYEKKAEKEQEAENILNSIDNYVFDELETKIPKISKDKKCFSVSSEDINNNRLDPYYSQPKFEEILSLIKKSKYPINLLKNTSKEIISGQRPKGGVGQIMEGIPSLGGEHILSNGLIKTTGLKFIPIEYHNKHIENKIQKKDILLVKDGATTGKIGIIPENYPHKEANINEHLFVIRAKENINPYFLMAFLKTYLGQIQIERDITGGTITGIIRKAVEGVKIITPSWEIQNKIANEVKERMTKAEQFRLTAKEDIKEAKQEVENIILGQ